MLATLQIKSVEWRVIINISKYLYFCIGIGDDSVGSIVKFEYERCRTRKHTQFKILDFTFAIHFREFIFAEMINNARAVAIAEYVDGRSESISVTIKFNGQTNLPASE